MCLACGCGRGHLRADGSCACGCKKLIEKWDQPTPIARIPLNELMQSPGEGPTPPKADVEAAAPKRDAE